MAGIDSLGAGFHAPKGSGGVGIPTNNNTRNNKTKTKIVSRFFTIMDDQDALFYSELLEEILASNGKKEIIQHEGSWSQDDSRVIFVVYKEIVDVKS